MSTATVHSGFGFDNRDFWVDNTAASTDEHFSGLVDSDIGLVTVQQTYSTYTFTANGLTYRYIGSFTFAIDLSELNASITASGSYDRIEVLNEGTLLATYDGPSRAVDFGGLETANIPDLIANLPGSVTDLLFGDEAGNQAYENLHTDATPNLPALAYADGVTATGGEGEDVLTGGLGADIFDGRGANDRLYGFAGDDTYIIRDAGDRVYEAAGKGNDMVRSMVSYSVIGQDIERLALTGTDDINGTGNRLDNILTGNSGDNLLNGAGGDDLMKGFAGDDRYFVNSAGDVVLEAFGNGQDSVASTIDYTLGANVENLGLLGTGDIDGTGNRFDNRINGNSGDNIINGKAGADLLRGNGGADDFVFDTHPVNGNIDVIADLSADDRIVLDDSVFSALAPGGLAANAFKDTTVGHVDANDRILYDHDSGALLYDADGSGAIQAVQFATVLGLPGVTAADFLVV